MDAGAWLLLTGLGVVLGALGQSARAIVGLKKLADSTENDGKPFRAGFDGQRLAVSLLIGGVAGALAMVGLADASFVTAEMPTETVLAVVAAGYAGADFIDGFIKRATPPRTDSDLPADAANGGAVLAGAKAP